MTVLYKAQVTRPSLDDLFFFELVKSKNIFISPIDDTIKNSFSGCISYTFEEMISWDEVFLRKEELRPDLKYQIESNSLTKDDMIATGPKFNPFSLTYTELVEYNSWEDAMFAYQTMFPDLGLVEYDSWEDAVLTYLEFGLIDMLKKSNNTYVQEHYIDGIKVNDWIPKIKV